MSHAFMVIIDNSTSTAECFFYSVKQSSNLADLASKIAEQVKLGEKLPWSLYSEIIRDSIRIENWVARGGKKTTDFLIYFNESKTILLEYVPNEIFFNKNVLPLRAKQMAEHWMNRMEMTCQTYIILWRFVDILSSNRVNPL